MSAVVFFRARLGALLSPKEASASSAIGLPPTTPALERAGAIIAGLAVTWMFLVAGWGVNDRFGDGHFAAQAAIGTAAENMWRFHTIYPVPTHIDVPPPGSLFYMHHPLGVFWVAALFVKIFGAHDWTLRLPAIIFSSLTPYFLYRLGRAVWGPLEGALSAVAFASLPITLGFASYHALEGPVILALVVSSWGYARFTQTGAGRFAAASVLGFLWAVNYEWSAYIWGAVFVSWVFVRGFVLSPRLFGAVEPRAFARYWALLVGAALVTLMMQVALLMDTGKLIELLSMYGVRSAGNSIALASVLKGRRIWIEIMYSGLAIALGKLAVPVIVARFVRRRSDLELLPIFLLIMATLHYVHFKQGADVHIFWSQYFSPYFALAVGALAATARDVLTWITPRVRPAVAAFIARSPWLGAAIVALPLLVVLRDGASMIRLARDSGGRFVSTNIKSDIDRIEALQWWSARLKPNDRIAFNPGIAPVHWAIDWELRPHMLMAGQPLGARGAFPSAYTLDSGLAFAAELRAAVKAFHVEAVGRFWMMDRSKPPAPLDGYSFEEHDPKGLAWYLHGGTEPLRTVRPDPWVTWEWRTLFDEAAPLPPPNPVTGDQIRIAYNVAVAAKDAAGAARWRAALEQRLDVKKTVKFDEQTVLLGAEHHRGAEHGMTLYFLAGPNGVKGATKFEVYAKVEKAPFLSTLPQDPVVIDVALYPAVRMELWKPGYIYSEHFTYRKRPGKEILYGAFVPEGAGHTPVIAGPGSRFVDLATL
jgi:dolichyl-phosphate-mannose-protein mannosyltransferase